MLTQKDYLEVVKPVNLDFSKRTPEDLLKPDEIKEYQSLLGKLNWLSCNTRSDIKFDVLYFAQYNKTPTVKHLKGLNAVAKRVRKNEVTVLFPKLNVNQLRLQVYSDASLGNLDDKLKSCKAYILFLSDGERMCALDWNSKKINRVCNDTLEAETRAMRFGVTYAISMMYVLEELLGFKLPIHSFIDSMTLKKACFSTRNVSDPILRIELN